MALCWQTLKTPESRSVTNLQSANFEICFCLLFFHLWEINQFKSSTCNLPQMRQIADGQWRCVDKLCNSGKSNCVQLAIRQLWDLFCVILSYATPNSWSIHASSCNIKLRFIALVVVLCVVFWKSIHVFKLKLSCLRAKFALRIQRILAPPREHDRHIFESFKCIPERPQSVQTMRYTCHLLVSIIQTRIEWWWIRKRELINFQIFFSLNRPRWSSSLKWRFYWIYGLNNSYCYSYY